MSCCSAVHAATARHFDETNARSELASYRDSGPGPTTRRMAAALAGQGAGGELLDVGSGIGVLSLELLKRGLAVATCVDLAGEALAVGREEALRQGLADRMHWRQGDFVAVAETLPAADVVALDRVVCCYPEWRPLLDHATRRARRHLALSYPRDRWYVKLGLAVENLVRRLRGNAFRTFVHPAAAMDRALRDAGLAPVHREHTLAWEVAVYARAGRG